MKDTGLREERDQELYETYLRGLREQHFSSMDEAADWIRMQPASCYYVSSKALVNYIGAIERGSQLPKMRSANKQKIKILYQHYQDFVESHPGCLATMTREGICQILVDEPAPRFFIGHELAVKVLKKERRRHREELARRWR